VSAGIAYIGFAAAKEVKYFMEGCKKGS